MEICCVVGRLVVLDFLFLLRVDLECDDNGWLKYFYMLKKGVCREIECINMLYILVFMLDGRVGFFVIWYGVDVFGLVMLVEDVVNGIFKNGLFFMVVFKVDCIF